MTTNDILLLQANSIRIPLRDESVHAIVTSPPYWQKRSYHDLTPVVWGGDPGCAHDWQHDTYRRRSNDAKHPDTSAKQLTNVGANNRDKPIEHATCHKCGAWLGNLGEEPTPWLFAEHIAQIARELMRVLRPDGNLFLNIADSRIAKRSGQIGSSSTLGGGQRTQLASRQRGSTLLAGLKPKDLAGVPWLIAMALQREGWTWRDEIPWLKRNVMPEAVDDRLTVSHEWFLRFTKSRRCYWDADAIKQPQSGTAHSRGRGITPKSAKPGKGVKANDSFQAATARYVDVPGGRNYRSMDLWLTALDEMIEQQEAHLIHLMRVREEGGLMLDEQGNPAAIVFNAGTYGGAHYATYPPDLVSPLIAASTSEAGCCVACGAPWVRVREKRSRQSNRKASGNTKATALQTTRESGGVGRLDSGRRSVKGSTFNNNPSRRPPPPATIGWKPACKCNTGDPVPCTVLDPFAGTGSTLLAAAALGRRAIGADLSLGYLVFEARHRLGLDVLAGEARKVRDESDLSDLPIFRSTDDG